MGESRLVDDRTAPQAPAERRPAGRLLAAAWLPVLLGSAAAALTLAYLRAPLPSDQTNYFSAARDFPDLSLAVNASHQLMRLGIVLPARLGIELFGYSQAAYYLVPVTSTVLLALAVYAVANMLFGRAVGAVAAALSVTCGVVFDDLSMLMPDLPSTALFTAAVAVTLAVRQQRAVVTATARRRTLALLLIGFLLVWSYLCREFAVFGWPLVPLLLFRTVRLRGLLVVAAPMVAVVAAELATNAWIYGDALARLHVSLNRGEGSIPAQYDASYRNQPWTTYVLRLPEQLGAPAGGPWLQAALVLTVVGVLLRPRLFGPLVLWVALMWVPLTAFGGLLNPDAPTIRLELVRYWFLAVPPVLIGGVGFVGWAAAGVLRQLCARSPRLPQRLPAVGAAVLVLALGSAAVAGGVRGWVHDPEYRANGATQLEELRTWLDGHRDQARVLWTDGRTDALVPIFAQRPFGGSSVWSGQVHTLVEPTQAGAGQRPRPGDYVLIYSENDEGPCPYCRAEVRGVLGKPIETPPSWRPVLHRSDGSLSIYRVR